MNILISGGTGFIGSSLCTHLIKNGHHIVIKSRMASLIKPPMRGISSLSELNVDEKFDVVINLAGEPIAKKRWSNGQRQTIINSRLEITEEFISYFKDTKTKPALFISGSAIGFYGCESSDDEINEECLGDDSFSSDLCQQWEASAMQASVLGIRTCLLRTGIVLGKNGGALDKMLPPFKLGLGGKIGLGSQWMSWIHLHDLLAIIDHCIVNETVTGPINCTAPYPVTNKDFTNVLGGILQKPTLFNVPSMIIKLLMGEMGDQLLLKGKKIMPVKILESGFEFKYARLKDALFNVLTT